MAIEKLYAGIDYEGPIEQSVWGPEDDHILEVLYSTPIQGRWLNLAAGDGRYNEHLLTNCDEVIACDIDNRALQKLTRRTPSNLLPKLETEVVDIIKSLPYEENSFDGLLCTGTAHTFQLDEIEALTREMLRVVKPGGHIILDFETDNVRELYTGGEYKIPGVPEYTLDEAFGVLQDNFQGRDIDIRIGTIDELPIELGGLSYRLSCKYLLVKVKV